VLDDFPYSLMRDRQVGDPPLRDLLQMYHSKQAPPRPGLWTRFDHSFFNKDNQEECTYTVANDSSHPYPPRTLPTKTSKGSRVRRVLSDPLPPDSSGEEDDLEQEMEWSWRPDAPSRLRPTPSRVSLEPQLTHSKKKRKGDGAR
jgi:hypothetical protein